MYHTKLKIQINLLIFLWINNENHISAVKTSLEKHFQLQRVSLKITTFISFMGRDKRVVVKQQSYKGIAGPKYECVCIYYIIFACFIRGCIKPHNASSHCVSSRSRNVRLLCSLAMKYYCWKVLIALQVLVVNLYTLLLWNVVWIICALFEICM